MQQELLVQRHLLVITIKTNSKLKRLLLDISMITVENEEISLQMKADEQIVSLTQIEFLKLTAQYTIQRRVADLTLAFF